MKEGIGWFLRISGAERHISIWCYVSRKIDIKLWQNYTKIHIETILYKRSRFKQIIFSKYSINLKTIISQRNLRISGLLLLYSFNFYFAFLIAIIDNIITYSLYSPYYVTRTLANGVQYTGHMISVCI